jgi:ArsR family transcriptional regulator
MREGLSSSKLVGALRAAGEITRLRLLALLAHGEYNVKDLTQILSQSQPRLSRHLKLLTDAGLAVRFQEGSSVFFRLRERGEAARIVERLLTTLDLDDPVIARDQSRAEAVKRERGEAAQAYFEAHAAAWDEIRALHAPEEQVEAAMLAALGPGPFDLIADLGTGTGRILELVAPRARRVVGYDINRNMLNFARAKLAARGIAHAQVRQGDIFSIDLPEAAADAVIIHQVLHFLDDPAKAVAEAARVLKPGGRLLIADFASHGLDALREDYSHRRLGFEPELVNGWFEKASLSGESYKTVEPPRGSEGKLTVSIWLAVRPEMQIDKKRMSAQKTVEGQLL